jgi:4-hydroxybutyrate CoA-transferase
LPGAGESGELKIAVKYCGGCNPRFDRKALVAELLAEFPQLVAVKADDPGADLGLVVGGCTRGCAANAAVYGSNGKFILCAQGEYPALCAWVTRMLDGALA